MAEEADANSHAPAASQNFPIDEQDESQISTDAAAHQPTHQTYYIGSYGNRIPSSRRPTGHDPHSQQKSSTDETYWFNTDQQYAHAEPQELHSSMHHQQGYGRPPTNWDAHYDRMAMMNYPGDAAAAAAAAMQYQYHHAEYDPYAMNRSHDFVPPMYAGYLHQHPGAATHHDNASNPYHQPPDPDVIARYGYPPAAAAEASGDFRPPIAYGGGYRVPEQAEFSEHQQHQYQEAATSSSIYQARNRAKTFPQKLLQALVELENEEAVAWLPDGTSFVILNQELFVSEVLNKHFKASKYASFIRKLHRWGFLRLTSGTGADCFHHPMFAKDNPENAAFISCASHHSKASAEIKKSRSKPSLPGVERFIRSKLAAVSASKHQQRPNDDIKPAAVKMESAQAKEEEEESVPHHGYSTSTRESAVKSEDEDTTTSRR